MTSAAITAQSMNMQNAAMGKNMSAKKDADGFDFTQVMDMTVQGQAPQTEPAKVRTEQKDASESVAAIEKADTSKEQQVSSKADSTKKQDEAVKEVTEENGEAQTGEVSEAQPEDAETEESKEVTDEAMLLAMEEMLQTAMQVVTQVAQTLETTPEEVLGALDELGMQPQEILIPDNMAKVVTQVTGEEMAALVTDETLYDNVQQLTGEVLEADDKLMKDLGITPEDLKELAKAQAESGEVVAEADAEAVDEQEPANRQDVHVQVKESKTQSQDVKTELPEKTQTKELTTTNVEESFKGQSESGPGQEAAAFGNGDPMQESNPELNKVETPEAVRYTSVNTEDVMNQIMEQVKAQASTPISGIEIQLHPASLGTVQIAIAAKNGAVTAQFTTQDEAVKSALESQIVELKERLEQQGVKVEAVEVAVASHGFERNLEQNAQKEQQAAEELAKKKSTRKIDLSEGVLNGEEVEEADDAVKIARDMMRIHGNRMDYLV